MNSKTMKAVRAHVRGGPGALVFEDAPIPQISGDDVLVRVYAASTTPTEFTWNSTFTHRDGKERFPIIPSYEISGIVEEIPQGASDLRIGDAVYGLLDFWHNGAAAEYAAVSKVGIAAKPKTLDFISAAAVPLSGLTAWQALFDYAKLSSGERILIHGAGGGVGTFAVQLAHWKGAHVIATCSSAKTKFVMGLGADEVINYDKAHFEDTVSNLDVVLDTLGGENISKSWQTLHSGGTLVTIADDIKEETAAKFGVRGISFLVEPNRKQLEEITKLIDGGTIHPVIQAVFPLKNAREAYEQGLRGHNSGKIVLKVRGDDAN